MGRTRADRITSTGKRRYTARAYVPANLRHLNNGQKYLWAGTFNTARERDQAKLDAIRDLEEKEQGVDRLTVAQYADLYERRFEKRNKSSSVSVMRFELRPLVDEFGHRELGSIRRHEAELWADTAKPRWLVRASAVMNAAVLSELIDRNPFKGLAPPERTRADDDPPTNQELQRLLDACEVHGTYAGQLRDVIRFACFTGLRPCELCSLRWEHVDLDKGRLTVAERIYRGRTERPKSGRDDDVIVLIADARRVLEGMRRFSDGLVFHNKMGGQLKQGPLGTYWRAVLAETGLDFDFYLATRHYCAHYMWRVLGLPREVVRVHLRHVDERLLERVYGHANVGAHAQIEAADRASVHPLRVAGIAANEPHQGAGMAL